MHVFTVLLEYLGGLRNVTSSPGCCAFPCLLELFADPASHVCKYACQLCIITYLSNEEGALIHTHVYMPACRDTCTAHTYTCMQASKRNYKHVDVDQQANKQISKLSNKQTAKQTQPSNISSYTVIHTYIHTFIHTYIRTYVHTDTHTCMHACMHTYIHNCISALARGVALCCGYMYASE